MRGKSIKWIMQPSLMAYMQDYGKPYFSSQYEEKYLILCNKDKTADNTKLISWELCFFYLSCNNESPPARNIVSLSTNTQIRNLCIY